MCVEKDNIKVYLIEKNTSNGLEFLVHAYIDQSTCDIVCEEKQEEWASFKSIEKFGEEISGERVIIDRCVYDLDFTNSTEIIRERAIEKLTDVEIKALGIKVTKKKVSPKQPS